MSSHGPMENYKMMDINQKHIGYVKYCFEKYIRGVIQRKNE